MALVRPNQEIERRWNGALKARLAQAPLESFLQANGLKVTAAGHSENIARAIVYLANQGIELHLARSEHRLEAAQQPVLAYNVCLMARLLAMKIGQPGCWRVAALVSTGELLRPWMAPEAAAIASASLINAFASEHSNRWPMSNHCAGWLLTRMLKLDEPGMAVTVAQYLAARLSRARYCNRDVDLSLTVSHA